MPVPSEAIAVLQKFLDAGMRKDEPAMRACLTRKTLESGQFDGSGPQGVRYILGDAAMEGHAVVIPVKAYPIDAPPDQDASTPPAMQLQAVMVQEDGAWKFDLVTTMERMFSGGVEAVMQQAAESIGTAMQGMTDALGETLKQAFGESGETAAPNFLEASTQYAPEELLPLLTMTELPRQTAALSAICGAPVKVTAAIDDLLRQVGSDDRKTLLDWFDNSLFEGWQAMFTLLNEQHPFADRLKGIRIEPAKDVENRMLIVDRSDLVYRMFLNTTDGYYNDEWLAYLLPGMLASLPEKPDESAGHRLIHLETEDGDVELYKQRHVPRIMRRICEIVGKNLTLEANFDDIFNPREDPRQLYRWLLNRIHGALALACTDPARRTQLTNDLNGIRILLSMLPEARYAKFENGILEVSIQYFRGETGAFYETDLDKVLAGEAILPPPSEESAESTEAANEDGDSETIGSEDDQPADKDDDEPPLDEAARAKKLNDENFRTAAASLKENEPTWAMQIQMAVGHPVTLELDFDSLHGDYELVQPFIHQGMSSVVEAFPTMMMQKQKWQDFFRKIAHVVISGTDSASAITATLEGGTLAVTVPLQKDDVPPPTASVIEAFEILTGQPITPIKKPSPADVGGGDIYSAAARFVRELEAALRQCDMWPGKKPAGEIEVRGAFGSENMAFNQWLAWVMIPRVKEIVETRGDFPTGSNVAAYAVREWDGIDSGRVIEVLQNFDDAINAQ